MQGFNGSAHKESLTADAVVSKVESITRMKNGFSSDAHFLNCSITHLLP